MTEAEFKKHLDAAEKSPKEIAAAVSGLPERVLRYKPSPEKWCVLEVLGHLADVEIIYGYRLRQMLADTKPVIAPLDQDAWARNLNYLDSPPSELVAFYGLGRHHNLRLLRSLKASDLSKGALHPELQREMTVADLVERMGGHGAGHLQQIEKLKTAASNKQFQPAVLGWRCLWAAVNAMSASNLASAAPESTAFAASSIASRR
jgi:DinB superfamily